MEKKAVPQRAINRAIRNRQLRMIFWGSIAKIRGIEDPATYIQGRMRQPLDLRKIYDILMKGQDVTPTSTLYANKDGVLIPRAIAGAPKAPRKFSGDQIGNIMVGLMNRQPKTIPTSRLGGLLPPKLTTLLRLKDPDKLTKPIGTTAYERQYRTPEGFTLGMGRSFLPLGMVTSMYHPKIPSHIIPAAAQVAEATRGTAALPKLRDFLRKKGILGDEAISPEAMKEGIVSYMNQARRREMGIASGAPMVTRLRKATEALPRTTGLVTTPGHAEVMKLYTSPMGGFMPTNLGILGGPALFRPGGKLGPEWAQEVARRTEQVTGGMGRVDENVANLTLARFLQGQSGGKATTLEEFRKALGTRAARQGEGAGVLSDEPFLQSLYGLVQQRGAGARHPGLRQTAAQSNKALRDPVKAFETMGPPPLSSLMGPERFFQSFSPDPSQM
jgi:hypothetical protein